MNVKQMIARRKSKCSCGTAPKKKEQENDWSDIMKDLQPKWMPGDPVAVFRDCDKNDGFQTEVVRDVIIELCVGYEGPQKTVKYIMEEDYDEEPMDEEQVYDVAEKITEPEDEG